MRYIGPITLSAVSAVAIGIAIWVYWAPLPSALEQPLTGTLVLYDCRAREIAEIASAEARTQIPISLKQMGGWLPRVTVGLEDRRFYEHTGVDWTAVCASCLRNIRSGRVVSGGSTISQQLVKLASGHWKRSVWEKLYEALVAWKLERRWSKQRILAEYLNRSSFGNRRLGPEAAARAYFGKSSEELTLAEAIFLAGLPQAPTRFNPWLHKDAAIRKYRRSLQRLAELGIISEAQQELLAQSPPVIQRFDPSRLAPNFVDAVLATHPRLRGKVITTLDLDLQSFAESALRSHLSRLNRYDITAGALVIVDNATGGVRAMVGSSDYATTQINGAMWPHSCGSTLKPFVYLEAIDRHLVTAATLLPDTGDAIRGQYSDYDPQNFNRRYLGPVRVREALACSLNVPAVVVLGRVRARNAFDRLEKWRFRFSRQFDDYGAGFILGNAQVRLVDLAEGYSALARGGLAMLPRFLASDHPEINRMASPGAVDIITDILCDNDARRRSFGINSPLAFKERVAVKTGTSSGFRDAWTVGFDKEHTVAVWAGNLDGRPMRDTLSVRSAAPLWATVMQALLRQDHPVTAPDPSLIRCEICKATGLLPSRFSPGKTTELFLSGTEPKQDSVGWFSDDGKLLLPGEYASWCASADNTDGASVRPELRILSPPPDATYTLDPVLPNTQQMLELKAIPAEGVRWYANGQPVTAQRDGRFFWQLVPGRCEMRVTAADGSTLRQNIVVEMQE